MGKAEKYKAVFECARKFLDRLISEDSRLNRSILAKHFEHESKFDTIEDANRRLIQSLANRNMMSSVINFKGKETQLRSMLCDYDVKAILTKYSNVDHLFQAFQAQFKVRNARSKRNLWRKFAEGIISGSKFMASFASKEEFDAFIQTFSRNKYTKAALPMLLSREIKGFGLALACDFLKELGYRDYPKPDVHLIRIFTGLGLSESAEPYDVYKAIVEMAEVVGKDAYTVDKTFWLISSGNFYLVPLEIPGRRDSFIKYAKSHLAKEHK